MAPTGTAVATGRLRSVNVGLPRVIGTRRGRPVRSGFVKRPVTGRVATVGANLTGDGQADLTVHGGPDKAVYAYAAEDLAWWSEELGRALAPGGAFGENLTTTGVDCTNAVLGERWRVGTTVLEVCQPRLPCFKLGLVHDDPGLVRRFARASRPGAYLRIVVPGELGAGDAIEVGDRPAHGVTVRTVADGFLLDRALLTPAVAVPELAVGLREQFPPAG